MKMSAPAALALAILAVGCVARTASASPSLSMPGADPPDSEFTPERTEAEPGNPALAGAVDPDAYIVGPGDVFLIHLSGRISRTNNMTVGPEGTILIAGVGIISLDRLTLRQAHEKIERTIASHFHGVQVEASLLRVRSLRVFIVGDVKASGPRDLPATSRVSDALVGWPLRERASRRNVEVHHRDGSMQLADLELFDRTGRLDLNPYLQDGDVVRMTTATRFVEAGGAFAQPGRFELGPADSLRTLVDLAGGMLPAARRDQALLVRPGEPGAPSESLTVPLPEFERGEFNPPLRDGDRFFIYFVPRYHELEAATILGEVRKPGTYPLRTGETRLSDLVHSSGGFLDQADLRAIRLYRVGVQPAGDQTELDRLSKLGRNEMTESEFETFRANLAGRREDYRVDWTRVRELPELDIVLRGGDLVTIDRLSASVRVEGEVLHPGLVQFDSKRSTEDYVRLAGGYSHRASPGKTRITRAVTGQTILAHDAVNLTPGDLIWVPEHSDRPIWPLITSVVALTAEIATIWLAARR